LNRLARIALAAFAIALTTLPISAQQPAPEGSTTVFLVRHAEKEAEGADPSLTEAGRKRAKALADMLVDAGITAIFSSEFHRTQQTAAPLAERLGIEVTVIPAKDDDALVARVRELKPGARSLIVGHSNTIPGLVSRLVGVKAAEMSDADYDRLYVTTLRGTGPGDLLLLHFGERRGLIEGSHRSR
jgi:broad specificity phosphatase PhoE